MRVALFFDGKNFYSGWREAAKGRRIDFARLAEWLVQKAHGTSLWGAYYYTGIDDTLQQGQTDPQQKLAGFLDMLETQPGFFVHTFKRKVGSITCAECGAENRYVLEKEVDTSMVASEDRALALDFLLAGKALAAVPEAVALVHRGRGEHLSRGATFVRGRRQFLRKYRHVMGWREWLLAHANLMAVRAEHNADRRLLSKAQERLGLLLSRLAGRFPPVRQAR